MVTLDPPPSIALRILCKIPYTARLLIQIKLQKKNQNFLLPRHKIGHTYALHRITYYFKSLFVWWRAIFIANNVVFELIELCLVNSYKYTYSNAGALKLFQFSTHF